MPSRLVWQRHVDDWRASGLSAPAFAARHHLDPRSLYSWSSRLRRSSVSAPLSFLPVLTAASEPSLSSAPIEILLSHQRRILIRPGFDPTLLRLVVEALEGA